MKNLRTLIFVGMLAVVVLLTGCSLFASKELLPSDPSPQVANALKIIAPDKTYAHIYRDFPEVDDPAEEVVLEVRQRTQGHNSAWQSSIIFYWEPSVWVALGLRSDGKAYIAGRPLGQGTINDNALPPDTWGRLRIVLTQDKVKFLMSSDGEEWVALRENDRPEAMATPPKEIMVGKAYRQSSSTHVDHLDDSAPASISGVETSYFADLVLLIDGEEVIREEFTSLDDWDLHYDTDFEGDIAIELVRIDSIE